MRAETLKPFSDSSMARAKGAAQGSLPYRLCTVSSRRGMPGTPTERPPTTASKNSIGLPSGAMNSCGVAAAGAVSRASKVVSDPARRVVPGEKAAAAKP